MIKGIEFVKHLGIKKEGSLLTLEPKQELLNHVGSIHAGAIYTLAESQSGLSLMEEFNNIKAKALLRDSNIKYKSVANTKLFASYKIDISDKEKFLSQLEKRGKALIDIAVAIKDNNNQIVAQAKFSWFVVKE